MMEQAIGTVIAPLAARYDPLVARRAAYAAYEERHYPNVEGSGVASNPFTRGALGVLVAERLRVLEVLERTEAQLRAGEGVPDPRDLTRDRGAPGWHRPAPR